jgi:hypothetical protein
VELTVGVILENEYAIPISGPPSAVATQTDFYVRILPGDLKKGQLVKEILNQMKILVPDEQVELVGQIPQEDFMRVLPAGEGRIEL